MSVSGFFDAKFFYRYDKCLFPVGGIIMIKYFIEGGLLGLATGLSCAVFCLPVILGLTVRDPDNMKAVRNTVFFICGRFISYMAVAVVFSLAGMVIRENNLLKAVINLCVGVLLVYWGVRGFIRSDNENKTCALKKYGKTLPFLLGIMTGLAPCPPFIAGVARVAAIENLTGGLVYFFGFFAATSVFILPGMASGLAAKINNLKTASCVLSIAFGAVFVFIGIAGVVNNF